MENKKLTKDQKYRLKDLNAYRKKKKEYAKTPKQKEKRKEYMRAWREKNRERSKEIAKDYYYRNQSKIKVRQRGYHIKWNYDLTIEDYNKMLKEQDSKCKICGTHESKVAKQRLHVDHDHSTGEIRGLLCSRCNGALGWHEKYKQHIDEYLK